MASYEGFYNENLQLIKNFRSTFAASGLNYKIDLFNEGVLSSAAVDQNMGTYTQRMWADYTAAFGKADTVGFSVACTWNSTVIACSRQLSYLSTIYQGNEPNVFSFHFYDDAGESWTQAWNTLSAQGRTQPWIIGETYYNDSTDAEQFASAHNVSHNDVLFIAQWPLQRGGATIKLPLDYNNYAASRWWESTKVGVFRQGCLWVLDANGNHVIDQNGQDYIFGFGGLPGDIPIYGDWNGDGRTKVGFVRNGNQFFLDYNGNRQFDGPVIDRVYTFGGLPGDIPVIGDWTGNGKSKIGIYRNGLWILDLNGNGVEDPEEDSAAFAFGGNLGDVPDVPVVGDWMGTGTSNVGVFRQGFLWVLDTLGDHTNGAVFPYGGIPGDIPVVGDWAGTGLTQVGIFRQGFYGILDANGNRSMDDSNYTFAFGGFPGPPADVPVVGRW